MWVSVERMSAFLALPCSPRALEQASRPCRPSAPVLQGPGSPLPAPHPPVIHL